MKLPEPLLETAHIVGAEWMSTSEIRDKAHRKNPALKRTTLSQRLAALRDIGIIEARPSQEDPRGFDWRRVDGGA